MIARSKLLSVVCAVLLVAALGACGSSKKAASTTPSSSSPSSSPSSSTPPSSSTATAAPIKVGFICTCTGLGGFGGYNAVGEDVYKAWVNAVNASGGISGHPVQVITEDDASNPGNAVTAAQTLISDHVVAIADMSLIDAAFASAVQAANIPVVGVFTVAEPFDTNPDFYPEGQTNTTLFQALLTTAKAAQAPSISNFYCAEAPTCALGAPRLAAVGKQLGTPDVYNAAISATAPNYTAQCVAAQQKHASSLWVADASSVITRVAADCARQGYNPTYVTEGEVFGMNLASALKNNLWLEDPDIPFFANIPAVQAFNAAMDKYYPGLREDANRLNQDAFMAWISGKLLEDAIKAGGLTASDTPSAAEVKKGLESLNGDTVGGLTPALTFAAGTPHHIDCWFTARVQNGVPSMENNGQTTCAK